MSSSPPTLPPGDEDPNLIYIAVGRAIHAWEAMESALANLYLTFTATPFSPSALTAYGKANSRFVERKTALDRAATAFFVKAPDQKKEGQWRSILAELNDLAIERHRIAHGHISMWGEFQLPQQKGYFEVTTQMKYRWAAPWYSTETLRTDPVGKNAEAINEIHDRFSALHTRVSEFSDDL